ncbi:non-hydrolyzing UDP-N-acetylglucosamine 2-epimerase [Butyrivibrio sp. XPD2006]|uniref:non-hydrolyzing UDP-N-acetylglucosamine 2-epimerase n=1 Tax=Butyrivibrio sp. XPD2006 TaxID=1280668 RepID=UPI00047DBC4D|nr:UDP-N-acetylglucosamine 2-epimerase (non-hydrolyzing) [Butyrivibrio sp. XPD2006]
MTSTMVCFGTRPEAIKMCPVIRELKKRNIKTTICVTGQHRQMLDQVLDALGIIPDYDLAIMKPGQDLFDVTISALEGIKSVLKEVNPDIVLVHGDTSTTFAVSLACYYLKIPVGHVEAGLRTYDVYAPFPEEFNRQATGIIAQYHFAPTEMAKKNLISEGKPQENIFVTGNTAIDALKITVKDDFESEYLNWAKGCRLVLITAHRRENLGEPMHAMFRAIKRVLNEHEDVKAIYPVHLNPAVRKIVDEELKGVDRMRIIEPLDVLEFHNLMAKAYMVLTDSGGIQEEAPSLGKPVLVMRNVTERPEGIEAGTLMLVGTEESSIYESFSCLLSDGDKYNQMANARNPYGDGRAAERIVDVLEKLVK